MVTTTPRQSSSGKSIWNRNSGSGSITGRHDPRADSSSRNPVPPSTVSKSRATTSTGSGAGNQPTKPADTRKTDHPILFQTYFKSVGPRTYVAQVKQATNGNQYLVLTEGRRDKKSDELRKFSINLFSEDFEAFFNLLRDTTRWLKDHPLPAEFQEKRKKMWQKRAT